MYEAVNFKKDMIDGCVKSSDPSVAFFFIVPLNQFGF